jgi:hypothetical protein
VAAIAPHDGLAEEERRHAQGKPDLDRSVGALRNCQIAQACAHLRVDAVWRQRNGFTICVGDAPHSIRTLDEAVHIGGAP